MSEPTTPEGRNEPEAAPGHNQPESNYPQPGASQAHPEGAQARPDGGQAQPDGGQAGQPTTPQASEPWPLGPGGDPSSMAPPPLGYGPGGFGPAGYEPGGFGPAGYGSGGYGGYGGGYPPPPGPGGGYPPTNPYGPNGNWSASPPWGAPTPPRQPRRGFRPLAAAALVVAVAAAGVGIGHVAWGSGSTTPTASSQPAGNSRSGATNPFGNSGSNPFGNSGSNPFGNGSTGTGNGSTGTGNSGSGSIVPGAGAPSDVNAIAAKVDPALVDINVTFSYQDAGGAATGIVLTSDGEILTNNHVVEGATSISVTDLGNGKTYSASVVGYDSSADVAVIQLKGASGLQTAKIGDSSNLKVGEAVVAIGNAGGKGGTPSAAGGSITDLHKAITASDELTGGSENLTGLLETNADIQEGDSGGSLVNTSGEVVGMDTAGSGTYSLSTQGSQGFAIPINTAVHLAAQMEAGHSSSTVHVGPTAFLGVLVNGSSSNTENPFSGSSGSTETGVAVQSVTSGGAAQAAGITGGDVITSLGGQSVTSSAQLTKLLEQDKPGQSVSISWTDTSGQSHTATVTLGSGPAQ